MVLTTTIQTTSKRISVSKVFAVSAFVLSASITRASQTTCFATMASASVPERMHISPEVRSMDISGAKLFPLEITGVKGAESVKELESTTAGEVLSKVSGKYGTVAFVVRRPG